MEPKIAMTAIILAGGKNARVGKTRAMQPFGPETMLEALVRFSSAVFSETFIIVNKDQKFEGLDLGRATVLADLFENQGPLAALYTGLSYSLHQACFVLTCEPECLNEVMVRSLAARHKADYDIVCLEDDSGQPKPFPGVYLRATRHLIRLLLERGETSLWRLMEVAVVQGVPSLKPEQIPAVKAS